MPTPGTQTYADAQSMASAPASDTAIGASTLGSGAKALTVPSVASTPSPTPVVAPPAGSTTDAAGNATGQPAATDIASQIKSIADQYATEGQTESSLESQNDISGKTQAQTDAYNAYNSAKTAQANTIQQMRNESGGTTTGAAERIAAYQNSSNANIANLAAQYQVAQGALSAAQATVTDKINAQFAPLKDELSALQAFQTANNDDLTDSDKMRLQGIIDQQKSNMDAVQTAAQDIHSTLLKNAAPTAAYSAIDAVMQQYASGQIDGETAQSEMYAAASPYGVAQGDVPGISGNLPTVSMTADGTPDPTAQGQFLSALPPDVATLVKGIADYQINLNTSPQKQYKGAAGLTEAQMASLVSQYDPTWSQSQFASRQALQTNFMSGKYSQNINSLNTAIGHLADIPGNSSALGNTGFTPYNAVKNTVLKTFGSGAVTSASTNISAAVSEMANVFKGSAATDKEIANLGTITPNSSPAQIKSYVQTGINLLASRLSSLTDTYQTGMGKPPASSFLSPSNMATLSSLKDQGFEVDIPGVHFTDPVAYANASADNASELAAVRQEFPDLSPADALAQAQYNQDNGY